MRAKRLHRDSQGGERSVAPDRRRSSARTHSPYAR